MDRIKRGLALAILYLVAAQTAFTCFSVDPGVNEDPRMTLPQMIDGSADRPFVYRRLMPFLTQAASSVLGEGFFSKYAYYRWDVLVVQEMRRAGLRLEHGLEWWVFSWLAVLCFAGFAWTLQRLFAHYYEMDEVRCHALALLSLMLLPVMFGPINTMYDPASLFLFPLAFLALTRGNTIGFYAVFVLAIFNKETAFLLTLLFLAYHWPQKRWVHGIFQGGLFIAGLLMIRLAYPVTYGAEVPEFLEGSTVSWIAPSLNLVALLSETVSFVDCLSYPMGGHAEVHFVDNLRFLVTPSISLLTFIGSVAMVAFLLQQAWSSQPSELKRSFLLLFIPLTLAWVILGKLSEVRIFYEIYFLFCLMGFQGLRICIGVDRPSSFV